MAAGGQGGDRFLFNQDGVNSVILYRSMLEASDGLPLCGERNRVLGVRPGGSANPDVPAMNAIDVVASGDGGLSVAPDDPMHLPDFRRPPSLGGRGQDPVWWIDECELGPDLTVRRDSTNHALIEPSRPMSLQEFQDALAATRDLWHIHSR